MLKRAFCCAAVCCIAAAASADERADQRLRNWHQFRGPLATGVAPLADPPTEWSDTDKGTKNIKWKVAIPGRGSASPIVWDDRIYVLTAIKTDRIADEAGKAAAHAAASVQLASLTESPQQLAQRGEGERRGRGGFARGGFGGDAPANYYQFVVLCLDRHTGRTVWQRIACEVVPHESHHQTGSFASASPVTDGERLYASFGSRGIYCYDLAGNLLWSKDLGQMRTRFSFGEGSSPALHGDTLVVNWDHEGDSFIVALDARTGDEQWRQPRDEPSTWATPLVVEGAGRTQVVTTGPNRVRSYDLRTGELIWECGGLGSNPIATPVAFDGLVVAMSGHNDPAGFAVPLTARGDISRTDQIAWQVVGSTPYVASPLLYDDTLYFTKSRNAILSSVDARTGQSQINQRRLPQMDTLYASPVGAAGRIYIPSREGTTVVIQHAPELQILATNHLDESIDATPAIVGDEIVLRTQEHLYCIAEQ